MMTFLKKSAPALALILVLAFGFTMFAIAGNACGYLQAVAEEAENYAETACDTYGNGSQECLWAQADAGECWAAFWAAGCKKK